MFALILKAADIGAVELVHSARGSDQQTNIVTSAKLPVSSLFGFVRELFLVPIVFSCLLQFVQYLTLVPIKFLHRVPE